MIFGQDWQKNTYFRALTHIWVYSFFALTQPFSVNDVKIFHGTSGYHYLSIFCMQRIMFICQFWFFGSAKRENGCGHHLIILAPKGLDSDEKVGSYQCNGWNCYLEIVFLKCLMTNPSPLKSLLNYHCLVSPSLSGYYLIDRASRGC